MPADKAPAPSHLCDEAIAKHSLLQHPFYVAWNEGTLPLPALRDYAGEYGAFIDTIPDGWEMAGSPEIARIEREHAELWEDTFAAGLDTFVTSPQITEVANLVDTSRDLFSRRATALGALYAFEAQQPHTAQSKLDGLRKHYAHLPASCGNYFDVHQSDYDEPALLAAEIDDLNPADRQRAVDACERMSRALYDALSGIHAPYVMESGARA